MKSTVVIPFLVLMVAFTEALASKEAAVFYCAPIKDCGVRSFINGDVQHGCRGDDELITPIIKLSEDALELANGGQHNFIRHDKSSEERMKKYPAEIFLGRTAVSYNDGYVVFYNVDGTEDDQKIMLQKTEAVSGLAEISTFTCQKFKD